MTGQLTERRRQRRAALAGGAVFLASGAALVTHLVTGAPLALVLAGLVAVGSLTVARLVWAEPDARQRWMTRVGVGVAAGVVSTVAYDVSRWALVELGGMHLSPFKAFPLFGEALIGADAGSAPAQAAGIVFHLLNGIAFGVAYTVWFGHRGVWWGVAFALGLEAFMLALYPGWLDIRSIREFTQISVLGHVAYGVTLGWTARRLLDRQGTAA